MSFSSKFYSLDKEVLQNEKIIQNNNNTKKINIVEPKNEEYQSFRPSNYYNKVCSIDEDTKFGALNSCSNFSTIKYKPSNYIDKISNNSFISHIYEKNSKLIEGKIPYLDLHHNTQTKKGRFLLKNNMLNKIDDVSHFNENLLEDIYCKSQNKSKMELLDTF